MTMTKIPQYGDPELLPKPVVGRPSEVSDEVLASADIEGLPWARARGDEWTTAEFRRIVFDFLVSFFDSRDWPKRWQVIEKASAVRSGRLPPDQHHLVFVIARKSDGHQYETAVAFPTNMRERALANVVLTTAAVALDALQAADV